MSEFIDTMKKWRRMCDYYDEQYGDNSCVNCPLHEKKCGGIWEMTADGFDDIEEKVNAWNEPKYPTWHEYLRDNAPDGIIEHVLWGPIPTDIAKKLGLEPKT